MGLQLRTTKGGNMEGLKVETRKTGVDSFDVWVTSNDSRARGDEGIFCVCEEMPEGSAEVFASAFGLWIATEEGQARMAWYDERITENPIFVCA
jgi:hypothetical protein